MPESESAEFVQIMRLLTDAGADSLVIERWDLQISSYRESRCW